MVSFVSNTPDRFVAIDTCMSDGCHLVLDEASDIASSLWFRSTFML